MNQTFCLQAITQACLFVLLIVLSVGCFEQDQASPDQPDSQAASPAASPPAVTSSGDRVGPSGITHKPLEEKKSAADLGRIQEEELIVEDLLKDDSLDQRVKRELEALNRVGLTTVRTSFFRQTVEFYQQSAIDGKAPPGYEAVQSAYFGTNQPYLASIPTRSKHSKTISEEEATARQSLKWAAYQDGDWVAFNEIGIAHFLKTHANHGDAIQPVAAMLRASIAASRVDGDFNKAGSLLSQLRSICEQHDDLRRDPLVQACKASLMLKRGDPSAESAFDDAFLNFSHRNYPARTVVYFNSLAGKTESLTQPQKGWRLARSMVAIKHWLAQDLRLQPDELLLAYRVIEPLLTELAQSQDYRMVDHLDSFLARTLSLNKWLRYMVRGELSFQHVQLIIRDDPFAAVAGNPKSKFENAVQSTSSFFSQAFELNSQIPLSANRLMSLAHIRRDYGESEAWFQKSIDAVPECFDTYLQRLLLLQPQTGAGERAMIEMAIKYSRVQDPASDRPLLVFTCFHLLKQNVVFPTRESEQKALSDPELLTRCLEVADQFAELAPRKYLNAERSKDFFLTAKAVLATLTGDIGRSEQAYEKLRGNLDPDALYLFGISDTSFDSFRARSYALSSEYKQEAETLDRWMREPLKDRLDNARDIVQHCEKLLKDISNPRGRMFFERAKQKTELERNYSIGRKIQLKTDPAFLLWKFSDFRHVKFGNPNTLALSSQSERKDFYAYCIAELPGAKVIECKVRLPLSEYTKQRKLKPYPPESDFSPLIQTHTGPNGIAATVGLANVGGEEYRLPHSSKAYRKGRLWLSNMWMEVDVERPKQSLRMILDRGYCEVYLNGEFVYRTDRVTQGMGVTTNLFRVSQQFDVEGEVEFSDIFVQAIERGAPPIRQTPEALTRYYDAIADADAADLWAKFWFAQSLHAANRFEPACQHYQELAEAKFSDPSLLAFWHGDALDRQGEYDLAQQQYAIAAKGDFDSQTLIPHKPGFAPFTDHQNWAAFRLKWHGLFRSKPAVYKSDHRVFAGVPVSPRFYDTLKNLLQAQELASADNFPDAVKAGKTALETCPAEHEEEAIRLIRFYQREKSAEESSDQKPLYLKLVPLRPFATAEDLIY